MSQEIGDISQKLAQIIKPLADALSIGAIEYSFHGPVNSGANGVISLFSDNCEHHNDPFVETFKTSDGGTATFKVAPKDSQVFSVDMIQGIKMLLWDIFMLAGNARLQKLLQKASTTDALTGTDNQAGLTRFIGILISQNKLKEYASIFINLKNFRYVNKSLGSQGGDMALKMYVSSAKVFLTAEEMIARMGGDNFVILVKKDNVDNFIEKFTNLPITMNLGQKPVSFNIQSRMGIFYASEKDSISELLNNPAIALNVAKNIRNLDVVKFTKEMMVNAMHQREISSEFLKSLSNNEFIVYYQPKVNLQTKQLCGAEALVRWIRHNTIVPPVDFVPILEKEGSICALDFFVFETVCRSIQEWKVRGIEPVRVSVNFSKLHLRNENLANQILGIMRKYKVDSKYIEVELTEVSDYEDCQAMKAFVDVMRENGISVSIDDFGTGYSTLNVLKNFNVNVIKLDKSLLDNIGNKDSFDEVVVKNVVNLAKEMNKDVIAEGVETETQAKFLSNINCNSVQGFLFDMPLKQEEFEKRLSGTLPY